MIKIEIKKFHNKKAQAAMEFLTTYGWAILILLIVIVALANLGVFKAPSTPSVCETIAPFSCQDISFREGGFEISLGATDIATGSVTIVSVNGQSCNNINVNGKPNGQPGSQIKNGQNSVKCYGTSIKEGDKARADISIDYTRQTGLIGHEIKLSGSGGVEKSSYINNFDDTDVLSLSFNSDSGTTATDNSYYGNNGIINGATLSTTDCISGSCYSFNGASNFINIPDSPSLSTGVSGLTLEAWVNTGGSPNIQNVLESTGSGWSGYNLRLDLNGANYKLSSVIANSVQQSNLDGNMPLYSNIWYYVVFTWDGTASANGEKLYVNGVLDTQRQSTFSGIINPTRDLKIGIEANGAAQPFNGIIDNVRVYNRALTAQEIQQHYNNK